MKFIKKDFLENKDFEDTSVIFKTIVYIFPVGVTVWPATIIYEHLHTISVLVS